MARRSNFPSQTSVLEAGVTRRQVLAVGLGGLVAGGALIAFGPRAFAFSIVEADAPVAQAFHSACGATQYHDQLAGEVRTLLQTKGEKTPEQIACPVCGCKVAMSEKPKQD
jgi:hypothetical protein